MDAEDYIVSNILATMDIDDEHKRDIRETYDRVRKLFVKASANCNLDNFFLTKDTVNYCRAFGLLNTAWIHAAGADFQGNNLWANIYNKTIKNAGLTDEERSFLYCMRYMMTAESVYSQFVDRMCYLLVWQTKPPGAIDNMKRGKEKHCCKNVDTVDAISLRCPLATKLEFLAGNGFKDIADACDRELRNAAAHMMAIIGKPTVKSTRYETETTTETQNKFSIEGTDIRVRRRAKDGTDRWEIVDINKAIYLLEMAVWRYNGAFSLCQQVQEFATDQLFLDVLNNPDNSRGKITFSKSGINVSWNENPD